MVRPGELNRRFQFAYCPCRVEQPFRGKQIAAHRKANPTHVMSEKFRVCLGCLQELPPLTSEKESQAFVATHKDHEVGCVSAKKSRQFFAARGVSHYLKKRQGGVAADLEDDSEDDSDDDDFETTAAVAAIAAAVPDFVNEPPPAGIGDIEAPASQWNDYGEAMEELFGSETPRPQPIGSETSRPQPNPSNFPPPENIHLSNFVAPAPPPPPPPPPPPSTPQMSNANDSVFAVGNDKWAVQHRNTLMDKINDAQANNRMLTEKLGKAQGRIDKLKAELHEYAKKEDEMATREAVINSTEAVLREAQINIQSERATFEKEVSGFSLERETLAAEKEKLRRRDAHLLEVSNQLREAKARIKSSKVTELHIPIGVEGIVADPTIEGCIVAAGDACGHLRLKQTLEGVEVVSYFNTVFSKRLPTTKLHQPPATRPKL